jgi:hypothetical protein
MWTVWLQMAWGAPTPAAMDAASWRRLSQSDHDVAGVVEIFTAHVDTIDCFRGIAHTERTPAQLLDVVTDLGTAPRWATTGVTEGKVLEHTATSIVYYQYLDVPDWTFTADRFWVLQAAISVTPARTELAWDRLPSGSKWLAERDRVAKDHPDAIEPPINTGSWRFEPEERGTKITYSVCTESGGSIPLALQNAATRRTLPDNLGDVIREARRR